MEPILPDPMRLDDLLPPASSSSAEKIALIDADGRTCSYSELAARVGTLANYLAAAGVESGHRVALCADKSIDAVVALLGILQAGAAYVPIDAYSPLERRLSILADCSPTVVLMDDTQGDLQWPIAELGYAPIGQSDAASLLEVAVTQTSSSPIDRELAYILYTSGSTGKPKGVAHTHRSALSFIDWCSREFAPSPADRFSSHAPLHFDLSILDVFLPLKHECTTRLITHREARQPKHLSQLIDTHRLTFWYSTPSALRATLQFGDLSAFEHSSLRTVCFAGEAFAAHQLQSLARHWPQATFYNLYGPTETNVCSFYRINNAADLSSSSPIPIGFPCAGSTLRIASPDGAPVPSGQTGELLIHGPSVMQEYWGMPDHTSQAFVENDGVSWYRTGDNVVQRDDGAIVFLGRKDRMVKRRGYRIELAEIELALSHHSDIGSAAVVAVQDDAHETHILAFYTWNTEPPPSAVELKRFVNQSLPPYMCPDRFIRLPQMYHTSNDKIDYQKLTEFACELITARRTAANT